MRLPEKGLPSDGFQSAQMTTDKQQLLTLLPKIALVTVLLIFTALHVYILFEMQVLRQEILETKEKCALQEFEEQKIPVHEDEDSKREDSSRYYNGKCKQQNSTTTVGNNLMQSDIEQRFSMLSADIKRINSSIVLLKQGRSSLRVRRSATETEEKIKLLSESINAVNASLEVLANITFLNINVDTNTKFDKRTALQLASFNGNFEVVKFLVRHGGNVNRVDQWDNTAFWLAANQGFCDIIKFLADNGAEIDRPGYVNMTPLYMASYAGFIECVRFLLQRGANPNALNKHLNTPLHAAMYGGYDMVIEALRQHGAQLDIRNECDIIPENCKDVECCKLYS